MTDEQQRAREAAGEPSEAAVDAALQLLCELDDASQRNEPWAGVIANAFAAHAREEAGRALEKAADKIEREPAVNAIPFAEMVRALAAQCEEKSGR